MRKDFSFELDSSSSCSAASSAGDTPECQQPDSLSPVDNAEDNGNTTPDSVVPTAQTSTFSRTKAKPHGAANKSSSAGASKAKSSKRGQKEQLSKEEEERRRIRRERNKIAAAKCRNRRRELIDTLQAETDQLEDEKMSLQTEISDLLKEKEQLEQLLASHKSSCKVSVNESRSEVAEDCPASPQLLSMLDNVKNSEDMDSVPCNPAAAILGNSNILLCSHAQEQSLNALEGDDLNDLVPSLEMEVMAETTASVPDIDMGTPFCLPDWETLYKSVANDFESLSTPLMSSSPTCNSYHSVFSFNYSEIDSFSEGCETLKGGTSDFTKDLHSPTLLAL